MPIAPNGSVTTVGAPPTPDAYRQAVQQSLQPTFDDQQQQLAARLNALGILPSGAANKGFQDLTAQNNATVAGATAPLIAQGFGQQFQAGSQNAGAANAYQDLIQQQAFTGGQNAINNNLNAQEFDAGLNQQTNLANQQAANALQLAQMGYGNADYQQIIAQLAGLQSQGLGGQESIIGQGVPQALNAYTQSYNSLLPYSSSAGYASGYGTGSGLPGNLGYTPASQGDYSAYTGYNPFPGGQVTLAPGTGQGQDQNAPVTIGGGDYTSPITDINYGGVSTG